MLDTNVLVGAGFRPDSASGRLVAAARAGQLVAVWTAATRDEAKRIVGQIPPLASVDVDGVFCVEGEHTAPLDLAPWAHLAGRIDQTLAALALATSTPLVTADGPLVEGAGRGGVTAYRPAQAAAAFGL